MCLVALRSSSRACLCVPEVKPRPLHGGEVQLPLGEMRPQRQKPIWKSLGARYLAAGPNYQPRNVSECHDPMTGGGDPGFAALGRE